MNSSRVPSRRFPAALPAASASAALLLLLLAGRPFPVAARTITVAPTGRPDDYRRVREAMARLLPGDTLSLGAGVFDWSENVTDTLAADGRPGGMAVTVDRLTILGRKGAVLRGKTEGQDEPARLSIGANAAFRNAPGADGVTIRGLTLECFQDAVLLLQADSVAAGRPPDALRQGTRNWTLEDLWIRNGPFGISANGRHRNLAIRRCRFEMDPGRRETGRRRGSFAISVRPYPPLYNGLPDGVVLEDNLVRGPEKAIGEMFGGIFVTADNARILRNDVERYGLGLVVEGKNLEVSGNRISRCGVGIVAWTTNRLGTRTDRARITRNEIRGMVIQARGLLAGYSGSGILLAGVTGSEISDNIFANNPGADIVIGTVESTPVSSGNRIQASHGRIKLSREATARNSVQASQLIVIDTTRPGAAVPDTTAGPATPGTAPPAATARPAPPGTAPPDSTAGPAGR